MSITAILVSWRQTRSTLSESATSLTESLLARSLSPLGFQQRISGFISIKDRSTISTTARLSTHADLCDTLPRQFLLTRQRLPEHRGQEPHVLVSYRRG